MPAAASILPPGALEPPDAYARGFRRDDAAIVIDGYLRRLASQEGRCRLVLGRLAQAFLHHAGQHVLGFSRLDDYARERLGLSGRELQTLASIITRLDVLHGLRDAFVCGVVGWAHVRLLAAVATPETEREWVTRAAGRTVRALEALIRQSKQIVPTEDEQSDEQRVRFRARCPRRLVRLWRDVVGLARRVAGAELSHAQAAEVIAAEGLSARPAIDGVRPLEGLAPSAQADRHEDMASIAPDLDWTAVTEATPDDLAPLDADCASLDPFALDARMRAAVRTMHQTDWQMGRLLRVFLDRRLHLLMGFFSAARYLRERLGISERKARALVALERKTWQAPDFGAAYRAGELSWVRALTVLPVIADGTAAAWIARAQEVTVRRLVDEVEWALASRVPCDPIAPPPAGSFLEEPPLQMRAGDDVEWPDAEIVFTAPADVVALFRTAIGSFMTPVDPPWRGLECLLEHVRGEWTAQPRHRDPIFARDGWRCAVPACTARRNLHDHHVIFRSRGGDNAHDNRVTVCAWHHLRGIHTERVRARGNAPDGISWELGVRADRPPLLRLEGDRYVTPPS